MAYSLMAGLPVMNGLYITFFAIICYLILGSSKHASMGIYGVISLMVNDAIEKNRGILFPTATPFPNTTDTSGFISTDINQAKLMIASTLGFYVGIFMVSCNE